MTEPLSERDQSDIERIAGWLPSWMQALYVLESLRRLGASRS